MSLVGYRTRSLLSVGEQSESSEIIKELLSDEDVDDDYRLYELVSKPHDLSAGRQPFYCSARSNSSFQGNSAKGRIAILSPFAAVDGFIRP